MDMKITKNKQLCKTLHEVYKVYKPYRGAAQTLLTVSWEQRLVFRYTSITLTNQIQHKLKPLSYLSLLKTPVTPAGFPQPPARPRSRAGFPAQRWTPGPCCTGRAGGTTGSLPAPSRGRALTRHCRSSSVPTKHTQKSLHTDKLHCTTPIDLQRIFPVMSWCTESAGEQTKLSFKSHKHDLLFYQLTVSSSVYLQY